MVERGRIRGLWGMEGRRMSRCINPQNGGFTQQSELGRIETTKNRFIQNT